MSNKLNSASRILAIAHEVTGLPDSTPTLEGWAAVLEVSEEDATMKALLVSEQTNTFHREVGALAAQLRAANFPEQVYSPTVNKLLLSVSPMLFSSSWNSVKQYYGVDVTTALAFCVEILPDEEDEIPTEVLESIRALVKELRAAADYMDHPNRLGALIAHHADLIEAALREYPVSGAKAFRRAGREALGEIIEVKDELSASKGSPAVELLDKTWKSVNQAADVALKGERLLQIGQRAWDAVGNLLS